MAHRLTAHQVRVLATTACVDPRTADRWLKGEIVTSTCAARLEEALRKLREMGALPTEAS